MNLKKYCGPKEFYKRAVFIALPVMGQGLIQTLVSLIDSFMVAGLGDVKMSGVNISGQLLFVFMVLGGTICTTGGIFLTQFFGAGSKRGMQQALLYKIVMAVFCGLLYIVVTMVFPRQFLSMMVVGNTQAEAILGEAERYLFLMGFMGPFMMVSTIISSSLRETGQVKVPLVISVIATLINTLLNWVLIYGNLGAPRMEVAGAAYASIIARIAEMLMYILWLKRHPQPFTVKWSDLLHIDWTLFRRILKKGGMVIFSEMTWVMSETITTALYNGRGGADVVSGMSSSFAIANLFFVAFSGITTATSIILGKSLGAGQLEEARREKNWLMGASVVFGLLMTGVGAATLPLIPIVFASLSADARSICHSMVLWMAILMPIWVYQNTQFAVSRAGGDTLMGLLVDGGSTLGIIIPGVFLLTWFTSVGPVMMYILVKSVDLLKLLVADIWLRKERWVRNLACDNKDLLEPETKTA